MSLKYTVVLVWVMYLSAYKVVLTGCEVVLVNRNVLDSFRVGKDGCTNDKSVCTNSRATCSKSDGMCLCSVYTTDFRNPTTRPGDDKGYGCLNSYSIRVGVGSYNCALGPFQLIPYNQKEPATTFSDFDNPNVVMKSYSLRKVLVKFPDNATEMELQWLDKSYVDLNVSNNDMYFKWKRSVPNLQGTIITFNLYCKVKIPGIKTDQSNQTKCLRAKVLGTWSADTVSAPTEPTEVPLPTEPTVTSSKPKSSQITTKATSSVRVITAEPKSTASASSDEECSDLNKVFIALFSISLVVNVVLGIIVGFLRKKMQRNQDKNLQMEDHYYEEPSNYQPLKRNPLQDQNDDHTYQSLTTSQKGK